MKQVFAAEWLLLRRSPFIWFSLVLLALLSCVEILSTYGMLEMGFLPSSLATAALRTPDFLFLYVLPSNLTFGIPVILFFSSLALGGEYAWETVRWPLVAGYSRSQVLSGKMLALALTGTLGGAVNVFVGSVAGFLVNIWLGQPVGAMSGEIISRAFSTFLFSVLAGWVYIAFVAALVVLSRSALVALAIGLLVYFVGVLLSQVFMPGSGPWDLLRPYSLLCNAMQLVKPSEGAMFPAFGLRPILVLVAYGSLWFTLALVAFRRQDITG
jgi:ABC-type transport system involved in multi-copper enzyme maturation permease subunit